MQVLNFLKGGKFEKISRWMWQDDNYKEVILKIIDWLNLAGQRSFTTPAEIYVSLFLPEMSQQQNSSWTFWWQFFIPIPQLYLFLRSNGVAMDEIFQWVADQLDIPFNPPRNSGWGFYHHGWNLLLMSFSTNQPTKGQGLNIMMKNKMVVVWDKAYALI